MSRPLKFGHRGAKGYVAENTVESILKAIELGVDGIEIDVHKCKSGELVVFHDFTVDRITNGTGEISSFTLKELKGLMVLDHYQIPTLIEVLDAIDRKCILNIELKGKGTASKTVGLIENYIEKHNWNYNDFIVSSFKNEEIGAVFSINKKIPLGVLIESNFDKAIVFAKSINAVAIHPDYTMLTKENVEEAQAEGFNINTWTVNTPQAIKRMKSYNVNAIISDFPDRL
ncbi:glycerophosphodiester phosphodiesterase family protein [Lacinutrix sp. Bg11-31]|uniref:glycerophosphodiester phosphodiesterase n=1 Tax=Lacinutrix sp. Bg11-31 TaxID=2057808 RepID=UPI000C319A30|nr:glycerophosphodiester phosphodiesterase family protein [Lacinutrix sp. Bg11-31]AUC82524.1 glycerophosphodiester phosphodiesterase [Lacinutrix sp. Bg11-31]